MLRTETEFAEAESEEASAQGCRVIPFLPRLRELSLGTSFFDQK